MHAGGWCALTLPLTGLTGWCHRPRGTPGNASPLPSALPSPIYPAAGSPALSTSCRLHFGIDVPILTFLGPGTTYPHGAGILYYRCNHSIGPWGGETVGFDPSALGTQHHPAVRGTEHPCGEGEGRGVIPIQR